MRKDVHHGIENNGRCSVLLRDVFAQFHDAIGFAAQTSDRSCIVQRITRDGQFVDAPEADMLVWVGIAANDAHPSKGVDAIDKNPDAYDGNEPITGAADMSPQFDETDVEGEEHHYDTSDAEDKEEVIPAPLHLH